jgi:hypothetical protein
MHSNAEHIAANVIATVEWIIQLTEPSPQKQLAGQSLRASEPAISFPLLLPHLITGGSTRFSSTQQSTFHAQGCFNFMVRPLIFLLTQRQ